MEKTKSKWANDAFMFDNLRFLGIFSICFAHAFWDHFFLPPGDTSVLGWAVNAICIYGMPLFAFASGYGQKHLPGTGFFPKLASMYFAANILSLPLYFLLSAQQNSKIWPSQVAPGPAGGITVYIWYFLALLLWRVITPYVLLLRRPLITSTLFALLVYPDWEVIVYADDRAPIFELIRPWLKPFIFALRFYPFYLLGAFSTREYVFTLRHSSFRFLLIPVCAISLYIGAKDIIRYHDTYDPYRINAIAYLMMATSCLALMIAFIPGKMIPWITTIGQKSLTIYVFSLLIIRGLMESFEYLGWRPHFGFVRQSVQLVLYCGLTYLICFLSSRKPLLTLFNNLSGTIETALFTPQPQPTKKA